LIATGGTLAATCKLLNGLNANVIGCLALLELDDLKGANNVDAQVESLIHF
jgi:adenine phosphoribosyltransferase